MNLKEIREKYPQYNEKSDQELADALHSKYYSQLPKEEFYGRIGLQQEPKLTPEPQEQKGWEGVLADTLNSLQETPGALGHLATELPGQLYHGAKQAITNPSRALGNAALGLTEGFQGLSEIPINIAEYLNKKEVGNKGFNDFIIKNSTRENALLDFLKNKLGAEQPGDIAIRSGTGIAPFVAGGGHGILPMLRRAGGVSTYSAGQNQDPLQAFLLSPVAESAFKGALNGGSKVANTIKQEGTGVFNPLNYLKTSASPEKLRANLRAAEGTNTPLGRVIESSALNQAFENLSSKTFFAGGDKILENIEKQIQGKAESTLESLRPENSSGDLNALTKDLLVEVKKRETEAKNKLYERRNKIANEEDFRPEFEHTEKLARENKKLLQNSPLYQNDPDISSVLSRIGKFENTTKEIPEIKSHILDSRGDPFTLKEAETLSPTLAEAQQTASKLRRQAQNYYKSPDKRFEGERFDKLAEAIEKDYKSSIEKTGSSRLKEAQASADKNFKENFAPFLDENIYKMLQSSKDPQSLAQEIIRPSKEFDKYTDIEKVMNLLPEAQKGILGFTYLRGAIDQDGMLNPKKLSSSIDKLGNRQFEALFPDPKVRQNLRDYVHLRGMNEEALSLKINPKNGYRALTAILAAPTGFFPKIIMAHYLNKAVTNPKTRDTLVNKLIESQQNKEQKTLNSKSRDQIGIHLGKALLNASKSTQRNQK